jgi:para-aminobenzoate synthetase/4-amino-4-deoxychorismate lyase
MTRRWHHPPAELYALVENTPATILLESASPDAEESGADSATPDSSSAPHSRLFTAPLRVLTAAQPAHLAQLFAEIESAVAAGLYAAGYFTYECASFFEPTVAQSTHPSRQSSTQLCAWFGIYDRPHLFDHRAGAFLHGAPPNLASFSPIAQLDESVPGPSIETAIALTEEQYADRIAAIHNYIRSGDVYQLNFTCPLQLRTPLTSAALYQRLRHRQPAPYCAFLHTQPGRRILSFSPELFFRLESPPLQNISVPHSSRVAAATDEWEDTTPSRRITTRPMKGTAPRGRTTAEDRTLSEWLRNDPKNRAENVMIVDLLRNDLGRLCHYGTVRAQNLFAVERYPTLWQMTSTVTGELRPQVDFRQIFRALFPCGSVTGAPKVRAMQLLAKLEDRLRGIYTGAIGFFSKQESVFSVAIRTLEIESDLGGQHGKMGVGSGIVIDSDPAAEFRECLLKAEFLTRSQSRIPDQFSLVETLLWHNGCPLLELHLDRLEDSAHYFAFPCDRALIKAALLDQATALPDQESFKIRLLLHREGWYEIISGPVRPTLAPARIRIASQRTDPADPTYFHKTTHRPLYAEELKAATQAGFDEVLFLNLQGELTEGAIHNVFIEKDAHLYTPPIRCGLLPGVHRRHILETNSNVQEKILHIDHLRNADAIYLSNAVRGLRQAFIDWEKQ